MLRLVSTPHGEGPGYELDTRLRPSRQPGAARRLARGAFARYHDQAEGRAEDWERQALLKARACAGDADLGARVIAIAHAAAYGRGAPPAERVHHLRTRMERELAASGTTTPVRYDLKLGTRRDRRRGVRGAVAADEVTATTRASGRPRPRRRSRRSRPAATSSRSLAAPLRDGYRFLRRLEQRLRVLHGTSAQLIEEGAPGLAPLARRMGMRDGPRGTASEALLARYQQVTRDVRAAYLAVLGLGGG